MPMEREFSIFLQINSDTINYLYVESVVLFTVCKNVCRFSSWTSTCTARWRGFHTLSVKAFIDIKQRFDHVPRLGHDVFLILLMHLDKSLVTSPLVSLLYMGKDRRTGGEVKVVC